MKAIISVGDPGCRLPPSARGWVESMLRAALATLAAEGEVRVRIVGDDEMAAAHLQFSRVPGTTDVLTFDLRDDADAPLDADVLICADEARRQAAAHGHAIEREVLLYAVHAALHCLGEDDHDEAAAARIHAREDAVLKAIGVGAIFAAGATELAPSATEGTPC